MNQKETKTILLRSGWQWVNIGDVGHAVGALEILENAFPEWRLILWPGKLGPECEAWLHTIFPKLEIVHGSIDKNGRPDTSQLASAMETSDFLFHGSGAGVKVNDLLAWKRFAGKPYGLFGVTVDPMRRETFGDPRDLLTGDMLEVLTGASMVFTRETRTLKVLRDAQIGADLLEFGPDTTFGMAKTDYVAAAEFRRRNELEEGGYLCVVPRLRITPYHTVYPGRSNS